MVLAAVCAAAIAGGEEAIYPLAYLGWEAWKAAMVEALTKLGAEWERLGQGEKNPARRARWMRVGKSLKRKAKAFKWCGTLVTVRECEGCGEGRPGTGVVKPSGQACQLRICPFCARRRSRQLVADLSRRMSEVKEVSGYRWRFITLQVAYDPKNPKEVSVEGLQERLCGLKEAIRYAWDPDRVERQRGNKRARGEKKKRGLKQPGAGMFVSVELAGTGFVHAHLLYYGPYIVKEWLERLLKAGYSRMGYVWLAEVKKEEEKDAVVEVAKYCVKLPSGLSERWLRGEAREVVSPQLMANWEAATFGAHLVERLGVLRGGKVEEPVEEEAEVVREEKDAGETCASCGAVGRWRWGTRPLVAWVKECHAKNRPALFGSRFRPRGVVGAVSSAGGGPVSVGPSP